MTTVTPERRFGCGRALAPMLWVFMALAGIELIVVHLLVASLWSRTAAVVLSLLAAGAVVWLGVAIRSLATHPSTIGSDRIVLRAGRLAGVTIARGDVARVRTAFASDEAKARDTLNLGLMAYPNVLVDLVAPRAGRRQVRRVALALDDPAGFVAALSPDAPGG